MNKLLIFKKYNNGRNGKILCRTKGSKIKLLYRLIDFKLNFLFNTPFIFLKLIGDPNRNTRLVFVLNLLGFVFYILAAEKLKIPLIVLNRNSLNFSFKIGLATIIKNLNEGNFIFNMPSFFNINNKIARSAGMFGQLLKKNYMGQMALIRLRNGQKILLKMNQQVLMGIASNTNFHNICIAKAGLRRRYGFKPIVRGVATNPIDHPNGGRTPGGKVYRSFSFQIARSTKKTKKKLHYKNLFYERVL